jgi:hypothetical protein
MTLIGLKSWRWPLQWIPVVVNHIPLYAVVDTFDNVATEKVTWDLWRALASTWCNAPTSDIVPSQWKALPFKAKLPRIKKATRAYFIKQGVALKDVEGALASARFYISNLFFIFLMIISHIYIVYRRDFERQTPHCCHE